MHYLMVYVNVPTAIRVYDDATQVYAKDFLPPTSITVSPTLYTRLDDCHGAGNCCRVPFDLVYTDYDRRRIIDYDHQKIANQFGQESADRFKVNRQHLLDSLVSLRTIITTAGKEWQTQLHVLRNTKVNNMSGTKSCPYLFIGGDRYFCGVHPFKPLHCWYPHMVVRANESGQPDVGPAVIIGRMQYGRNHNFGCPVLFTKSVQFHGTNVGLFDEPGDSGPHYFDQQFQDDIDKLSWTSNSAESMGFTAANNFCVGIDRSLASKRSVIKSCLEEQNYSHIDLR
jgi:Fe-S-cluster containining protein